MDFESNFPSAKFFQDSVEYLRHVVSREGIHTSKEKLKQLQVSPLQQMFPNCDHSWNGKPLRQIRLTDLSAPLNKLLRKDILWNWTDEC